MRRDHTGSRVVTGQGAQPLHCLPAVTCGHGGEQRVAGPVVIQRVRHVGQSDVRIVQAGEPVRQPAGRRGDPLGTATAHHQGADRRIRLAGCRLGDRGLLHEHMGVGAADPEG